MKSFFRHTKKTTKPTAKRIPQTKPSQAKMNSALRNFTRVIVPKGVSAQAPHTAPHTSLSLARGGFFMPHVPSFLKLGGGR